VQFERFSAKFILDSVSRTEKQTADDHHHHHHHHNSLLAQLTYRSEHNGDKRMPTNKS